MKTKYVKKILVGQLLLIFTLTSIPAANAQPVVHSSVEKEAAGDRIPLSSFFQGQQQSHAHLKHRATLHNNLHSNQKNVARPNGVKTPNKQKIVFLSNTKPGVQTLGSTYLAIYDIRTKRTLYGPRIPVQGHSNSSSHKIEAVNNHYALVSHQGKLFQVTLNQLTKPAQSIDIPGVGSSGMEVQFTSNTKANIISGDTLKTLYTLSIPRMRLQKARISSGIRSQKLSKRVTITATTSNLSAFGKTKGLKFLLAIQDKKKKTTIYKEFSSINQNNARYQLADLGKFKIQGLTNNGHVVRILGADKKIYTFSLTNSNKGPERVQSYNRYRLHNHWYWRYLAFSRQKQQLRHTRLRTYYRFILGRLWYRR